MSRKQSKVWHPRNSDLSIHAEVASAVASYESNDRRSLFHIPRRTHKISTGEERYVLPVGRNVKGKDVVLMLRRQQNATSCEWMGIFKEPVGDVTKYAVRADVRLQNATTEGLQLVNYGPYANLNFDERWTGKKGHWKAAAPSFKQCKIMWQCYLGQFAVHNMPPEYVNSYASNRRGRNNSDTVAHVLDEGLDDPVLAHDAAEGLDDSVFAHDAAEGLDDPLFVHDADEEHDPLSAPSSSPDADANDAKEMLNLSTEEHTRWGNLMYCDLSNPSMRARWLAND